MSYIVIRPIELNDYYKNYMKVINIFTKNPLTIDFTVFEKQLQNMLNQNAIILVAEYNGMIVGTLKIMKEYKLHNNVSIMAHIEDVAVLEEYRNKNIGTMLIKEALKYTKDCYKVVLSSKLEISYFYQRLGFSETGVALTLYN